MFSGFKVEALQVEGFCTLSVYERLRIIQSTYSSAWVQLAITVALCICSRFSQDFAKFQMDHPDISQLMLVVVYCFTFVKSYLPKTRNPVVLSILAFPEAWIISHMCQNVGIPSLVMTVSFTLSIITTLLLYACSLTERFTVSSAMLQVSATLFATVTFFSTSIPLALVVENAASSLFFTSRLFLEPKSKDDKCLSARPGVDH
mmetsp:Transcript_54699/g.62706  ORF Transcript_54699/g.62706 Transcript_54699/m.62706 type:complete len:203 (+) Transcript_54699:29-637(+)